MILWWYLFYGRTILIFAEICTLILLESARWCHSFDMISASFAWHHFHPCIMNLCDKWPTASSYEFWLRMCMCFSLPMWRWCWPQCRTILPRRSSGTCGGRKSLCWLCALSPSYWPFPTSLRYAESFHGSILLIRPRVERLSPVLGDGDIWTLVDLKIVNCCFLVTQHY